MSDPVKQHIYCTYPVYCTWQSFFFFFFSRLEYSVRTSLPEGCRLAMCCETEAKLLNDCRVPRHSVKMRTPGRQSHQSLESSAVGLSVFTCLWQSVCSLGMKERALYLHRQPKSSPLAAKEQSTVSVRKKMITLGDKCKGHHRGECFTPHTALCGVFKSYT